MSQKLIKIKCNLTGKEMAIYEDYYEKKILQYGDEEKLKNFYIQNKIITLIKSGHSIKNIAELLGFNYDENKKDYYKKLIEFHSGKKIYAPSVSDEIQTDNSVSEFINRWVKFNNSKSNV